MNARTRNLVLDIFDYAGNKVCPLYDAAQTISGQAANVVQHFERNGWKSISFVVPGVMNTENGVEKNYRLDYLRTDYKIRAIDDNGTDWYILSEDKMSHSGKDKNVSVTAGHISQLLKTKQMGLVFNDDEGNNIGTAAQFLDTILEGTGWKAGDVATFYEKDGKTEKVRTLVASEGSGAFKLITSMCDLFDARPVFNGDRTVDIIPMNPFSLPTNGGLPDVTKADGVLELHYGHNLKNVTRTLNSDNLITCLYPRGSWGDDVSGYCGIDECEHLIYKYRYLSIAGYMENKAVTFVVPDDSGISTKYWIDNPNRVDLRGHAFRYNTYDPASRMFILDETDNKAYKVYSGNIPDDYTGEFTLELYKTETEVNGLQSVMSFDYYNSIGLISDDMLQVLAEYYLRMPDLQKQVSQATIEMNKCLDRLSSLVGSVDYCRLKVKNYTSDNGYVKINLDKNDLWPQGVYWRTDYEKRKDKQFEWRVADVLKPNGDALNGIASTVYIIHKKQLGDTFQLQWQAGSLDSGGNEVSQSGFYRTSFISCYSNAYIDVTHPGQSWILFYDSSRNYISDIPMIDNEVTHVKSPNKAAYFRLNVSDGSTRSQYSVKYADKITWEKSYIKALDNKEDPSSITLWLKNTPNTWNDDRVYLFWTNNVNGYIGALETADEAAVSSLATQTKVATVQHLVEFGCSPPSVYNLQGYGWFVKYGTSSTNGLRTVSDSEPTIYFCWRDKSDSQWIQVNYGAGENMNSQYYYYNWKTSRLYRFGTLVEDNVTNNRIVNMFPAVWKTAFTKEKLYKGQFEKYLCKLHTTLPAGNYALLTEDKTYVAFTTSAQLYNGDTLEFDTTNRWITQTRNNQQSTLEIKSYRFDNVTHPTDNMMSGVTIFDNKAISNDTLIDSTSFCVTNYIPVIPQVTYEVTSGRNYVSKIYLYDKNKKSMGTATFTSNTFSTKSSTYEAAYMRLMISQGYASQVVVQLKQSTNSFVVKDLQYVILDDFCGIGSCKGLMPMLAEFDDLADETYITKLRLLLTAQEYVKELKDSLINTFGELYREGYWTKNDYVDGDEDKLFADSLENIAELSKPNKTYSIGFLDLYTSNHEAEYYATPPSDLVDWPIVSPKSAVHLVDPEIGVNEWAYIDKADIAIEPWKTKITINTSMSTISQKSFQDIISHIAEVAQKQSEMAIYARAKALSQTGQLAADRLKGHIEANTNLITNSISTFYTTPNGGMVWEAADQTGALMLTGNGLALASEKNSDGTWNWRTFSTGQGVTADEIVTGFLSAERIEAGTIQTEHLSPAVGETLDITANSTIADVYAQISLNSEQIELKVSKDGIISAINMSSEEVKISGPKISLNGTITANGYFKINNDGSMETIAGKIGGWTISATSLTHGTGTYEAGMQGYGSQNDIAFYAGGIDNPKFKVTHGGAVTCSNISIIGGTIAIGKSNGNDVFKVDSNGKVTCRNLNVIGGSISGDAINGGTISGTSINIGNQAFTVSSLGVVEITKGVIKIGTPFSWYQPNIGTYTTRWPFYVDANGDCFTKDLTISHEITCPKCSMTQDGFYVWNADRNNRVECYWHMVDDSSSGWVALIETLNNRPLALRGSAVDITAYSGWINLKSYAAFYGGWGDYSSREVKHDIKALPDYDDIFDEIKPVSFIYNSDPMNKTRYGFIYEDIIKILPDTCMEEPHSHAKTIMYTSFIPILVKEIQTLRERVKQLEDK